MSGWLKKQRYPCRILYISTHFSIANTNTLQSLTVLPRNGGLISAPSTNRARAIRTV